MNWRILRDTVIAVAITWLFVFGVTYVAIRFSIGVTSSQSLDDRVADLERRVTELETNR